MSVDATIFDDPIWEYTLVRKLQPYVPAVRRWWSEYENMKIVSTGVCAIKYDDIEVSYPMFKSTKMLNCLTKSCRKAELCNILCYRKLSCSCRSFCWLNNQRHIG